MFLRTDTHWSPLGAETVAQRLGAEIRETHLLDVPAQNFVTRVGEERTHKGDLLSFLPLDPLFDELLPRPEQLQQRTTEAAPALPGGQQSGAGDDLFGDSQQPRLALVGTSYSASPRWNFEGALKQALSADLINYAKEGKGPSNRCWNCCRTKASARTRRNCWSGSFPSATCRWPATSASSTPTGSPS